jgi:hypothetical protein
MRGVRRCESAERTCWAQFTGRRVRSSLAKSPVKAVRGSSLGIKLGWQKNVNSTNRERLIEVLSSNGQAEMGGYHTDNKVLSQQERTLNAAARREAWCWLRSTTPIFGPGGSLGLARQYRSIRARIRRGRHARQPYWRPEALATPFGARTESRHCP